MKSKASSVEVRADNLYENLFGLASKTIPAVPQQYWCGHYLDPKNKKRVIQDGDKCCFRHWISLPKRWGKRHPFYSWQEDILNDLKNGKRFFYIRKPPKIGATEFWLGFAEYQAMINKDWEYGQVGIVVGTGKGEAAHMISRCKDILEVKDEKGLPTNIFKYPINWDYNTRTEFSINTVEFKAYPALNKHIDAIRSQPNMRMIIGDEVAFFTDVEQQKIRDAFEHYIGGSDVIIALITTAGDSPSGFAYEIEMEEESIYEKYLLDYRAGLEVHPESMTSLYRKSDIDEIRNLPSFGRNFLGKWGHGSGDIFDTNVVNHISKEWYDFPKDVALFDNVLAIDPAYGKQRSKISSKFAGLGMYRQNGKVWTRSYFELTEPTDKEGLDRVQEEIDTYHYTELIIDAHWTGIINHFKTKIRTQGFSANQDGLAATDNASQMVKDDEVRIHPSHEELGKQMRAVRRGENGQPDKKRTRYDLGDCLHMCLWKFRKQSEPMHFRISS